MPRMLAGCTVAALVLTAACASKAPTAPASSAAPAPASPLDALERRLLSARSIRVHARVASGGRIESHFEGTLLVGAGQKLRMDFSGDLGARPSDVRLVCDGAKMRGGSREKPFDFDAPPALREGIVVEWVRMGMLHDIARLSEGQTPDHLDGTVKQWVRVEPAGHSEGEVIRGAPTEHWTYLVYVAGERAAEGDLWTDAKTGLPVRRRQTVHLPEGDMDVGEEYEQVEVDGAVDDTSFVVTP
jgi:hypothetical protein